MMYLLNTYLLLILLNISLLDFHSDILKYLDLFWEKFHYLHFFHRN